jgi:hypothetical protein
LAPGSLLLPGLLCLWLFHIDEFILAGQVYTPVDNEKVSLIFFLESSPGNPGLI